MAELSTSSYFNSLPDCSVKQRYRYKINEIGGLDPYQIKKAEWSSDMEKLPEVTWPDLVMYLVFGVNEFTINHHSFKAFKSLEAYNQFLSGWVRDITVKEIPDKSLCLVSCRVMHSQRLTEKALQPWVIAEKGGAIKSAHCDCMAGLGETCTHVASLLFAVEFCVRRREKNTVTQEKAYWMVPAVKKVPYAETSCIDFSSPKKKKKTTDKGHSSLQGGLKSQKDMQNSPTHKELNNFYKKLHASCTKPVVLSIMEPYASSYIPKVVLQKYPKPLVNLHKPELYGKSYKTIMDFCRDIRIKVTPEQSHEVECDIRIQSNCKLWFAQRAGRITASKIKSVCHSDPRMPSQSLVKAICYSDMYRFSNAATDWGCQHEKDARNEYEHYMKTIKKHSDFKVKDAGLVIDINNAYIGASPDGFVACSCCGSGCIEVKCPFCARDCDLSDVASTKTNFCLKAGEDGTLSLKQDHPYYYQVITQIHVTNSEYCDFVLWTPENIHYERIMPNISFWERVVKMATQFFRLCLLPELVAKFYTTETNDVTSTDNLSVCYCHSAEDDNVTILCADDTCRYGRFHLDCLGFTDLILTEFSKKRKRWLCPECSKKSKNKLNKSN